MSPAPRQEESPTTGDELERFVPETMPRDLIAAEHQARYRLAFPHVRGKSVLDAGCGVGWAAELLFVAGASAVTGVDIAPDAIEAARSRNTAAQFVVGDMAELPFDADSFDVVVCFEALEHVHDTPRVLDELVRVLRPEGMLFVSSPNPAIYPAGNPFHLHELTPDELRDGVAARLPHLALYRQHLFVSSLLVADSGYDEPGEIGVETFSVAPVEPGHDPYSVVVASSVDLPVVAGVQVIAPSHQLANLDSLATALTLERADLHADHQRMVTERAELLSAQDAMRANLEEASTERAATDKRLVAADVALRRLTDEIAAAQRNMRQVMDERDAAVDEVASLATGAADLRALVERTAAERDRFGAALVQLEQLLAARPADTSGPQIARLQAQLERTAAECDDARYRFSEIQNTVSWRITGPLRRVRSRMAGRL